MAKKKEAATLNVGGTTRSAVVLVNGEEVTFVFRKPTDEELQEYQSSHVVITGQKAHNRSLIAQKNFFDLLITEIRDLVDEDGVAVTAERKDVIPTPMKADIIFQLFEQKDWTVVEKN